MRFEPFGRGADRASRVLADLATAVPRVYGAGFPPLVPVLSAPKGPGTLSSPRSRTVFDLPDSARYDIRLLRVYLAPMMRASTTTMIRMITQTGSPPSSSTGVTGPGGSGVGAGTAVAGRSAGAGTIVGAGGFVGAASAIVGLAVDAANGTTVGAPVGATVWANVGARAGTPVGALWVKPLGLLSAPERERLSEPRLAPLWMQPLGLTSAPTWEWLSEPRLASLWVQPLGLTSAPEWERLSEPRLAPLWVQPLRVWPLQPLLWRRRLPECRPC